MSWICRKVQSLWLVMHREKIYHILMFVISSLKRLQSIHRYGGHEKKEPLIYSYNHNNNHTWWIQFSENFVIIRKSCDCYDVLIYIENMTYLNNKVFLICIYWKHGNKLPFCWRSVFFLGKKVHQENKRPIVTISRTLVSSWIK